MLTIWATICKEILEFVRDRSGLLVLLVMPMALVLIVSLVQDSVMQATGEAAIRVLFVDRDNSFFGPRVAERLQAGGGLELVRKLKKEGDLTEEAARAAVRRGDYQFCVIIPPGTGESLRREARVTAAAALVSGTPLPEQPPKAPAVSLSVVFDPAVQATFRTAVLNSLQRVVLAIEMEEKAAIMAEVFPQEMKKLMARSLGAAGMLQTGGFSPDIRLRIDTSPLLAVTESVAYDSRLSRRPTAAQQNVPAWALFGMFFIVVPLSGALLRERQTGTMLRLLAMPASPLGVLIGKACAYVIVCLAQFALMVAAGVYLLPLIGTSGLPAGPELLTVAPIAVAAALAATGYGIMVGTLARTYEQASMFGAVSIVIAAAIGGIMIPVYVMPRQMQDLSVVSPLAWGLNAFQDVFVRGETLAAVAPEIASLLTFFVVTMGASWLVVRRRRGE